MRKPFLFARTMTVSVALAASSWSWAQQERPVTVYGSILSSTAWTTDAAPGLYSFTTEPSTGFSPVKLGEGLTAQGGGVLAGDVYYSINGDRQTLYAYDADTWELLSSRPVSHLTLDMTYDPTTDRIYGCFVDGGAKLGILKPEEGTYEAVADLGSTLTTLFCDAVGTLYGISAGMVVRIDKATGAFEYLGPTGLNPMFAQSATIDPTSGNCYWAAVEADMSSGLYEINMQTYICRRVKTFPDNEEITGLFILPQSPDKAPGRVENLKADFPQGSLSGTVTFTMPSTTTDGTPLAEATAYRLVAGDDTVRGSAQPGTWVSVPLTLPAGRCKLVVTASNAAGTGDKAILPLWAGPDVPSAIGHLRLRRTATTDGTQEATLSWTAPQTGEHGGWFDDASLAYTVVRMPDSVTVATDLQATRLDHLALPSATLGKHWFTVTPHAGGTNGASSVSNKVIAGPALAVPFDGRFGSEADFDLYTVADANGDGKTWTWNQDGGTAHSNGDADATSDDWLITPPLQLSKAGFYKVTFTTRCNSDHTNRIGVSLGTLPEVEDMGTTLLPATEVTTNFSDQTLEARFPVPADGAWHLGFHLTSDAMSQPFDLDNIRVEQMASASAPAAVSGLTATPGAQGTLTAEVSFTLPTATIDGQPLQSLTKADLYRNDTLLQTFSGDDATPGKAVTYADAAAGAGLNAYKVVASNASGAGNDTTVTAWVGIDVPAGVANVEAVETRDGVVAVTWEAPAAGAHGGYIDPQSLTYSVKRNGWLDIPVGEGARSATDSIDGLDGQQRWVSYTVAATSSAGTGNGVASPYVPAGKPYGVPFEESFANGRAIHGDWLSFPVMGQQSWMPAYNTDAQDADNGVMGYANYGPAAPCRLMSPKILLEGTLKPRLSFCVSHSDIADTLRVWVFPDGAEPQAVAAIDLNGGQNQWQETVVDLAPFVGRHHMQLGFTTQRVPGSARLYIDNIKVTDALNCNLEATELKTPTSLRAEEEKEVKAVVTNVGTQAVSTWHVGFYNGATLLATVAGTALQPGESTEVACTVKPTVRDHGQLRLMAVVGCEGDENAANDTVRTTLPIYAPDLPMAEGLAAAWNGSAVDIGWNAPDFSKMPPTAITDDFESYEAFTISDLSPWTIVDKGGNQYSMEFQTADGRWITYPHSGDAISFQVIDLSQVIATEADGWTSVSGNKILISPYTGSKKQDWLISPLLYEGAQTIRVNAKSLNFHDYGLETLRVYVSTTDTNPDNFTLLAERPDVPEQWTEYSFDLPEDANHFAIVAEGINSALFLDDITYVADGAPARQLALQGYNVWRDGTLLNDTPVGDTRYTDITAMAGHDYTYQVTVAYDEGESDYTAPVSVSTTGITDVNAKTASVKAGKGFVTVTVPDGTEASLWTTDGRRAAKAVGTATWNVAPGCYIVKAGPTTRKVVVR